MNLDSVACATRGYPFKVWGFGESIAMEALLAAGGDHASFAADLLGNWAAAVSPLRCGPLAHVVPGVPLLQLHAQRPAPILLERALELAAVLANTTVGRHAARIHRPDLHGWEHAVWVDCMHLDGPFLTLLSACTGDRGWAELGGVLLLSHARILQDERSGLFAHGFDDQAGRANGVHWGRGQGWALLGLTDTLDHCPNAEIAQRLAALVAGLADTEANSGAWHTVVDDSKTYIEASVAAFVALGVGRAIKRAQVPQAYTPLAARALDAMRRGIDTDGRLQGVSDATPVGHTTADYGRRPCGVFPWGQGPALMALLEHA